MGSLPWAQCRTIAASAETRCAAAAAASPVTATTAGAGPAGPAAGPVRRTRAAGLRSCAAPRFYRCGANAALAHHHARMQEKEQFGRRTAGGVGREQPVELAGLLANLFAMKRHAGNVVIGPFFRAPRNDEVTAFRLDKLNPARIRETFLRGIDNLNQRAVRARRR